MVILLLHRRGVEYLTFSLEPVRFLPLVLSEFRALGGRLALTRDGAKVTDLAAVGVDGGFDVVVNCTGVWARDVAKDPGVRPMRGQVRGGLKSLAMSS